MFQEDSRTASFLRSEGISFKYTDSIKVESLHPEWQVSNLGRREAVNDDAVEEYALRMESGETAPAVVVCKTPRGYEILDGVQRILAAILNGATTFPAYDVSSRTSHANKESIRICANARINGRHTPHANDSLETAVEHMFFDQGKSDREVARWLGVGVAKVRLEIKVQYGRSHLQQIGYEGKLVRKKWFLESCEKHADPTDWQMAPGPIKAFCNIVEDCRFSNGDAKESFECFFDIKRSKGKDRHSQFQHRIVAVKDLPEVRQKLNSGKKIDLQVNLLGQLRGAVKAINDCLEKKQIVHDSAMANKMSDCLGDLYRGLRKIIPDDIQYIDGRRSSILDKG